MPFLGATIIAGSIFFAITFVNERFIYAGNVAPSPIGAMVSTLVYTAMFVVAFHYIHNWLAALFRWYRLEPGRHRFDRHPALDEARQNEDPHAEDRQSARPA